MEPSSPPPRITPFLVQISWFILDVCSLTLVVFVAGYWVSKVQEAYQQGLVEGTAECSAPAP